MNAQLLASSPDRTTSSTNTVAVAGNPNAGKTAVFNALTGVRQKTGNWPGVTVERKAGRFASTDHRYAVVDLPGTYSLDPTSPDQRIAADFLASGAADVVLDVVDATNLERHLSLTLEVAAMGVPMVIALNMMDVARRDGLVIDADALAGALGCEVVPVVARTGEGIDDLIAALDRTVDTASIPHDPIPHDQERQAPELEPAIGVELAERRSAVAHELAQRVATRPHPSGESRSDRIDRIVIHRLWGIPIFLAVMYAMFMFTINIGGAFIDMFDGLAGALFVDGVREVLALANAPEWLAVVLADGLGGGIQVVATFVPIIGALYLFLSLLEDSGYLARAAFVMDRAMRRIGLPGKAFVPMIVGFGCNVPAVMATRTLNDQRERKLTILMNPFMSCGARLPVYALFAAAFFPGSGQNLVFVLYLVGVAVAIATGLVMKHSLLPGRSTGFLMDLPAYHRPRLRNTLLHTWDRLRVFLRSAGRVIVAMVMVLAILDSTGTDGSFGNEASEDSVLAEIGRTITPAFGPMGIEEDNWPATVGIFTGVLAKEAVVGTLDSLYGSLAADEAGAADDEAPFDLWSSMGDAVATVPDNLAGVAETVADPLGISIGDVGDRESAAGEQEVDAGVYGAMEQRFDGRAGAFAYLLFVLLYFPCVAVIGAIVREAGRRWALFVAAWTTGVAYIVATGAYQISTFTEHPAASTAWLAALAGTTVAAFAGLRRWAARPRPAPPTTVPAPPPGVPVSLGTTRSRSSTPVDASEDAR